MNYSSSERNRQEQCLNNSVYSVISQEKELENDKARIRRKFFLDKISLKNNNMNKTNFDPDEISLLLNNSMPIEDKMLSFNNQNPLIQNKQNENHNESSLIQCESKNNLTDSSFTAKLEDNACVNPREKIPFETDNILNDISNYNDDDYYNLVSSHRYEEGILKGNTVTNKIQATSNSIGNLKNNFNNNNSFHSMNYFFPQLTNQIYLQNKHFYKKGQTYNADKQISFKNHPNVTIRNLFCDSKHIDHTSVSGNNEEHFIIDKNNNSIVITSNVNNQTISNDNTSTSVGFKFINDIKEKNDMIKSISLRKFLSLNKESFFNLFLYIYDNYYNLLQTHFLIEKKIAFTLNHKYNYIIERFRNKYGSFLDVENFELGLNEMKQKTIFKNVNTFSLLITAKILHWSYIKELQNKKINNISYELAFHYDTSDNLTQRKFINYYKFDVHNSNTFPLWLYLESEEFKHKVKRVTTTTSVQVFTWNDSIKLKINLIQNNGVLVNNVEWLPIKLELPPDGLYEKNMSKNDQYFDYLRYCEMENAVGLWKSENEFISNNNLIIKIKKIFEKHFIIMEVKYDILKLLFIKIKMKANKIGILDNESFIKCKLQIVDKEYSICNEITPMICINSLSNNSDMPFQIRKDTIVYLYLTDIIEET